MKTISLRNVFFPLIGLICWISASIADEVAVTPKEVPVIAVSDSINPGTADYIMMAIEKAEEDASPYLVIRMDTPGGLLNSTRDIVKKMLNAKTPVVVFIGPKGAHAGSAGAIIALAADVVAMAPGTNIGAAHPVIPGGKQMDETMRKKIANDTAAFAESIAKAKGRSLEWARKFVMESSSLIAEDALKNGVIDLIAENTPDLLSKLPGFRLRVTKGDIEELPKNTLGVKEIAMSVKHRLVSFFADPNLAYLIMSLGGLCIWVELTHPGLVVPGVLGVVCVILSLISFQMLPISYGALAFIFLGLAMVVGELFLPTYGLLGLGGIVAFVFGSLFLMDSATPEFQISLGLILPTAAVLATFAFGLGFLVLRSRNTKQRSGMESLVGEFGEAKDNFADKPGRVFVHGELWSAISQKGEAIQAGTLVVVTEVRGMVLVVDKRST